ncbi:MAG: hypothetical protein M0R46_07940 [Candidatus Muirbacterium halophilum]|nr:hypothetical protein [Candidatus Muirbacterium halophilum]
MNIYDFAVFIKSKTNLELFFVGGCVRDLLMNKKTEDYDICSAVLPDQMKKICKNKKIKCISTGIKYGTVTIILDNVKYEHTTWRKDVSTLGRSCKIDFTDNMKEDAKRRDFTINALYKNVVTNEIFDFFGGREHIKRRVLCFVGNAAKRIEEDYLRIFRFFRFINKFDLDFNKAEFDIVKQKCCGIKILSNERVKTEIFNMFKDGIKNYDIFTQFIEMTGNFHEITSYFYDLLKTPQNHPYHNRNNVLHHTLDIINMLNKHKNSDCDYYCVVFHDMFKSNTISIDKKGITHFYGHDSIFVEKFKRIMQSFRLSNVCQKKVSFFVCFHLKLSMFLERIRVANNIPEKEYFNLIYNMYSHNSQSFVIYLKELSYIFLLENQHKFNYDFKKEFDFFMTKVDKFELIYNSIDKKDIVENINDKKEIKGIFKQNLKKYYCE